MKIVKEKKDKNKHDMIVEDSRGYRFHVTVNENRATIEECKDYNLKLKPI